MKMRGRSIVFTLAALTLGACATLIPPPPRNVIPTFLAAAVGDPARPEVDRARDADRKPAESLVFAGLTPGMKVADVVPGGGYFTRIFSVAVGPSGHVYAYVPDELTKLAKRDPAVKAIADDPRYNNVSMIVRRLPTFATPEKLDMVWTSQNYHDMHNPGRNIDIVGANKAVFNALKPGGVYIVLDHQSAKGVDFDANLHRIDKEKVKAEVLSAGFQFVGESTVLANPNDDGTKVVFDPSVRRNTNQFILKFKRPK